MGRYDNTSSDVIVHHHILIQRQTPASPPGILVAVMMRKKIVSLLGTFGEINLNTVSNVHYHSVSKAKRLQDPVLFFVDTESLGLL